MRGFERPARFDSPEKRKQFRRRNPARRTTANPRKNITLKPPDYRSGMVRRPSAAGKFLVPFTRHGLERIGPALGLLDLPLGGRIDLRFYLLAGRVAALARLLEAGIGIGAKRERILPAPEAVLESPPHLPPHRQWIRLDGNGR